MTSRWNRKLEPFFGLLLGRPAANLRFIFVIIIQLMYGAGNGSVCGGL